MANFEKQVGYQFICKKELRVLSFVVVEDDKSYPSMFYLHGGVAKVGLIIANPGDVQVMLWPYVPMELDELVLYVAPLLADPHFDSAWETAPVTNDTLHFEQCDSSSFLQARFQLCGSLNGTSARVASISLDVWYPKDSQSNFYIVPRNEQDMKAFGRKQRILHILLKDAEQVAEWAVPTVRPLWWDEMKSHVPWQCNFPSNNERLHRSDRAKCMYFKRGCWKVESIGSQHKNSTSRLQVPLSLDPAETVRTSQFVLCARESKEPPEWALSKAWRKCEEDVRHPPDLLCAFSNGGGIQVTWFIGKLGKESSTAAEAVVAEGCAMLMNFTAKEHKKRKLESVFFLSAVDTGRVSSVNFVLSHCVDFSKWELYDKADLGKVVWKKLAASSWASDVLSALLSTSLAEGMMLTVIEEACFECVGLLQSWATKNPPKSPSWIGWSETKLYLEPSEGLHGITSFLEVLAQWLQLPFVLFGITSLLKVGYGTTGGSGDTAVAKFISSLAHAGQNLTKVNLAWVFWDVQGVSSLRPLGEQMPLLQEISFFPDVVHSHPCLLSADAVKALFLDGAGNFRFPKLQQVEDVHILNDEAAVAWAKIEQIHKIPSVDLHLEKVTDVGRAALKPPPSDAEIRDLCKVNASRSDSEQLALESRSLDMALDRGFLATMRSVLDYCISFAKWNYTARLSILDTGTRSHIDYLPDSWPKLLRSKTSDKLSMMLNTSFAECLVVTAAETSCEKCVGLLQSWAAKNKPKGSWIAWSGTELELALKTLSYGDMPYAVSLLDSLSQWLQLPFILFGIKSLEVGLPATTAYFMTEYKSTLMRDEVRLPRAKLVQSLTHAGQNLTALKIANFLVVLNTAPALRLFGPLPLLQTMLLAAGAGDWHVSMSADAVKALFLDDAGNFKFPKLQNLSIELLDDGAAVELSNVMHGRKMKALRVPKLSNLTDGGWATVHRLKTELGVATTS